MNIFAQRYIQLKKSHPELAEKMPNEIQNVISNVLYTYMKEHEDIYRKLDIALWTDLPHSTGISFPVGGSLQVDCYRWEQNRVYINSEQYFEGVPESAWNFYIGGYQPAQKWLKDRKGMTLSFEDVKHYQRIIYVLQQTERIMQEIDVITS